MSVYRTIGPLVSKSAALVFGAVTFGSRVDSIKKIRYSNKYSNQTNKRSQAFIFTGMIQHPFEFVTYCTIMLVADI